MIVITKRPMKPFNVRSYLYIREFIYKLNHQDKSAIALIIEKIINNNYDSANDFISKLTEFYENKNESVFNEIINKLEYIQNFWTYESKYIVPVKDYDMEYLFSNIHRGFFNIEFFKYKGSEKIDLSKLSSGEQRILILFAKLFYVVRKVKNYDKASDILIILDEPDLYMHPEWQKGLVNSLLEFLNSVKIFLNKKIEILITTHSPFILSDIPKQNIIFMQNGYQFDPFKKKETFAANIHTLLSDGFFMRNGLMGTFAKKKLTHLYEFLTEGNSDQDMTQRKAKTLIDLIGEPLIQKQFIELYEKKYQVKSKDEIINELLR